MQQKPKLVLKAKGFRMWKSGKRWVFGLGAMTAIFFMRRNASACTGDTC
ncbi:KxYKxGKxW signal peptide domain-containing protein [Streptococcus ruminantium]